MPCHPACTLPGITLTVDKVSADITGMYWHTIPIQAMAYLLVVIAVFVKIFFAVIKIISQLP